MIIIVALALSGQIMGNQTQLMGGEDGFFTRYPALGGAAPTVTLASMPYTRTVTCTGSYTLTGTATESPSSVSWSASPSGDSGSCTGTSSFSCVVAIAPNAAGEGVETITVTATNGTGNGTDTETIGFYVNGAHSCFLAQSVDGSYNSTLVNNDPVTTWENLGSSALDVTQSTAGNKPTFKTSLGSISQPFLYCDGGDYIKASTSTDWDFMVNGTVFTVNTVKYETHAGTNGTLLTTGTTNTTARFNITSISTLRQYVQLHNGSAYNYSNSYALVSSKLNIHQVISNDDGGAGVDNTNYLDNVLVLSNTRANSLATNTSAPLSICGTSAATDFINTAHVFSILIYRGVVLSSTQRGINKAVDEWALSGTFPVTP